MNPSTCQIVKSAVPNRYFFTSSGESWCNEVSSITFTIISNSFSFTYSQICHTGSGHTMNDVGTMFDLKTTSNWIRIYPEPK